MTRIVDNKKDTLANVLNREFRDLDEIAVATAYFNIRGFGAIVEGLDDKPMRLLLGREPQETIKWEDEILKEMEEYEDDSDYFNLLQRTIQYFIDEKRQVRIISGKFFHGKAFIAVSPNLTDVRRGLGVVGSSNFTYGGLVSNRELNIINTDREVVQELSEWFLEQWGTALDFKDEFLSMLQNYVTTWSPYEVVAKALYETYKGMLLEREERPLKTLYLHQQLTYIDAKDKLKKYGGVIIADSTGLGKSRVALALAHEYIRQKIRPLLIAPKAILETTWRSEMNDTLIQIDALSAERLSQNPDIVKEYIGENGPKLVIVDEAHYFRSPSTNRYHALQELITKNGAKIVLMTATPVNTSLMDLYSLMSLYLPDNVLVDMGHKSLIGYFTNQQKRWLSNEPINMDDVLRRFVVRHSRMLAKALDKEGKIHFPTRLFDEKIKRYPIKISLQQVNDRLNNLNLVFYDLSVERLAENYRLPDGRVVSKVSPEKREDLKRLVKMLFVINLFKRLESSYEAFRVTLNGILRYMDIAIRYTEDYNVFIPPKMRGDLLRMIDKDEDVVKEDVIRFIDIDKGKDKDEDVEDTEADVNADEDLAVDGEDVSTTVQQLFARPRYKDILEKCKLTDWEKDEFIRKCKEDKKTIEALLKMLPSYDDKYAILEQRLHEIMDGMEEPNGVIVFTQFADTANYLYSNLKESFQKVMLVTGRRSIDYEGNTREDKVVKTFQERGGLLISTDVLAAGQNLQNAQYVVNYDFPWNPVLLIQRVGRVDRIGSPHERVYIVNVLPRNGDPDDPESLEHFLKLMTRLYARLEMIRSTIGVDASTLGEEAAVKDFSIQERIARNDITVIEMLEKRIEQFTRDPIDYLSEIINKQGLDWVKKIPNGIGAVKRADFEGLFVLFTDTDEENFYWRLELLDNGEMITSPTNIVDLLLSDERDSKGEQIPYDKIIPLLRAAKSKLMEELREQKKREKTLDLLVKTNKKVVRQIDETLLKYGEEGERLAAMFRKKASSKSVVEQLWRALHNNRLIDEARAILPKTMNIQTETEETVPEKLKRVCWCYIRKA